MSETLVDFQLSSSEAWQIEQICDEFEAAWKAGQQPKLESFLRLAKGRFREALLSQLLPLELEYRWRAGEMPRAAEYELRFPSLTKVDEHIAAARREAFKLNGNDQLLPERIGEYRLLRLIGRGGMGVVYEALHERLDRRVALKMLSRMSLADTVARERFRREAEATAKLSHPNIVQVFEVGEHQGQPFLALEYVPGPSLAEQWTQARQSPREAAQLVEQLARAIHYAHQQGIVHRDLKPGNVLISPDRPKITDFGLAVPLESSDLTITGEIVGTPDYMSPEQASGKSSQRVVGKASDVYALGAILYSAVTGRPPFQGATALDALELVRSHDPILPTRINPSVPRDLETICLKCLEKDPSRRYLTAEALADDLERFQTGKPIAARRAGSLERFRRWCRRNPVLAVAAVLGLIAMLLGAGFTASHSVTLRLREEQKLTKQALADVEIQKTRAEENAKQLADQQKLTRAALVDAERFRRQAEGLSTSLSMERGLALLDQGDVARGMLLLGHCLQIAPASDADLHRVIRANLAAVHRRLPLQLHAVMELRGEVRAAVFSPDGKQLFTGGRNSPPQLWDVATGNPIGKPLAHSGEIKSVLFSHDGAFLVTASTDKTVRLWDPATAELIGQPLSHPAAVHAAALSPDSKLLVTGCNEGTTTLWELPSGKRLRDWKQLGSIHTIAFSSDGQRFVTGTAVRRAQVWTADGNPIGEAMLHGGEVLSAAFRPDGLWVVTGSEDGNAQFWDAATGKPTGFPVVHRGAVRAVGYSADGKTLWTGGAYGQVRLWDAALMTPLGTPIHHQSVVHTVSQTADRRYLATGSADGMVRVWVQPKMVDHSLVIPHKHLVYCVAVSPDGQSVVSGTADPTAQIWNAKTGAPIGQPLVHQHSVLDAAYSPDSQTIVTGSIDKTARLWNAADGSPIGAPMKHVGHVYAVSFSPDGQYVLTGCKGNNVQLWNAKTGEPIGEPIVHPDWVHAAVYSPQGEVILTGCEDGFARLWNATTHELIGDPIPHRGPVKAAAYSPDGYRILTGTWGDRTARLWDPVTGEPVGPPLAHQEHVLATAFSPDGKTMATGAWDGTARLWDVATGRSLGPPLVHQYAIRDLTFSPDGSRLWTAAFDRTVKAWEIAPPTAGDVNQIVTWLQVLTGLELDTDGVFRELNAATWLKRRERLMELGGPPTTDPFSTPARVDSSHLRSPRAQPSS